MFSSFLPGLTKSGKYSVTDAAGVNPETGLGLFKGGRVCTNTKHKENWNSGPTTNRLAACGTTRADFSWRDRN